MAYSSTPVAHTVKSSGNGNQVTTDAIDTTGADLIVVAVGGYNGGGANTLTDSKSNSWTKLTEYVVSTGGQVALFYCQAPTVGSGHTFTGAPVFNSYMVVSVSAWSGSVSTPFDAENGASGSTVTTLQPGAVSPGADNELVITAVVWQFLSSTMSINGGFSISDQVDFNTSFGGAMAYLVQTTAASANPTWTFSVAEFEAATGIACFKAAGGGGGTVQWGPLINPGRSRIVAAGD